MTSLDHQPFQQQLPRLLGFAEGEERGRGVVEQIRLFAGGDGGRSLMGTTADGFGDPNQTVQNISGGVRSAGRVFLQAVKAEMG